MRLINADKLRHELIIGHDLVGAKYTDMADTVEAIPIEWLHSIMKKQLIFAMNSEMEGTTTVQDGVIHCVSGALACQVLANVIELWEKEKCTIQKK